MPEVNLKTFPSTRSQALALLYLQNQDLSALSPEDLAKMYVEVQSEIKKALAEKSKGWLH